MKKKIWIIVLAVFLAIGISSLYIFNNVPLRTSIIRSIAKGGWYVDSENDTVYTAGYFGVRKYLMGKDNNLKYIIGNDEFCNNTMIARSTIVDEDVVYVICRSYLGGLLEIDERDYRNGALIVLDKSDFHIIKDVTSSIKYVEGEIINDKLILSGIMGYDIYDVSNRKSPKKIFEYRTNVRSEFQGLASFELNGRDFVVFARYTEGLQIWDVTDASNPVEITLIPLDHKGCMIFDVIVDYPFIYSTIAPNNEGFGSEMDLRGIITYDITDMNNITISKALIPRNQWYTSKIGDKEPTFIEKYKNQIFVNFADKGVAVFDVSTSQKPQFIGTLSVNNNNGHVQPLHITENGILISGNYWWDDTYIFDIAN